MRIHHFAVLVGGLLTIGAIALPLTRPSVEARSQSSPASPALCPDVDEVPASSTLRTLELPQFDVEIEIPANFRTRVLADGIVEVLDPGTFAVLDCVAQGGRAIAPRGAYAFRISRLSNPSGLPLPELIQQQGDTDPSPRPYSLNNTPVLITRPEPGYTVRAWFIPAGSTDAVVLSESCDCELEYDDMVLWLQRTRLR